MAISRERELKIGEEAKFEDVARRLHDALAKSEKYGQYVARIEKAGRMAHAIQFKHETPSGLIFEISTRLKAALAKRQNAVSEHQGKGRFSPGILITPSRAERRIIIRKIG